MNGWAERTFLFVWLPSSTNTLLAAAVFQFNPGDFSDNVGLCYATVFGALCTSIASFLGFRYHEVGPRRMLVALIAQSATLIVIFAGIYRGYGLVFGGQADSFVRDATSAL